MQDKRIQRGKNTLAQLTATCWELIETKSFNALSIDAICAKVGVTKGAFYHHFKNKDELFQYTYACKMNDFIVCKVKELQTQYPLQIDKQILGWIKESVYFIERYPSKLVFMPGGNPAWTGPLEGWISSQINILQDAQNAGILRDDISARDIWEVISSYIYGTSVLWIEGRIQKIHADDVYLQDFISTFFKTPID